MTKNKQLFTFIGTILLCICLLLSLSACAEIDEDPENVSFFATAQALDGTCKYLLSITATSIAEHPLTSFTVSASYFTADGKSVAVTNVRGQTLSLLHGESREFTYEADLSEFLSEPCELTVDITPRELTFGTAASGGGTETVLTTTEPGDKVLLVLGIGGAALLFVLAVLAVVAFVLGVELLKPIAVTGGAVSLLLTAVSFLGYGIGNVLLIAAIGAAVLCLAATVLFIIVINKNNYWERYANLILSVAIISFISAIALFAVFIASHALIVIGIGIAIVTVLCAIIMMAYADERATYPCLYVTVGFGVAAVCFLFAQSVGIIFALGTAFFGVAALMPWMCLKDLNETHISVATAAAFGLGCAFTMIEYLPSHLDAIFFIAGPELLLLSVMLFLQYAIDKIRYGRFQAVSVILAQIAVPVTVLGLLMMLSVNVLLSLAIAFGILAVLGFLAYVFHLIADKWAERNFGRFPILSAKANNALMYSGAIAVVGGLLISAILLSLYFVFI